VCAIYDAFFAARRAGPGSWQGELKGFILHGVFLEGLSKPQDGDYAPLLPRSLWAVPTHQGVLGASELEMTTPPAPLPSHTDLILQVNCFSQLMEQFRD